MSEALARKFVEFHRANPEVYRLFERFTQEAIDAGHERLSADMIMHRVRWETNVATKGAGFEGGRRLKINNNLVAYYARLYMLQHPDRRGFFQLRKVRDE